MKILRIASRLPETFSQIPRILLGANSDFIPDSDINKVVKLSNRSRNISFRRLMAGNAETSGKEVPRALCPFHKALKILNACPV
jgi:hypothetical protein